MLGNACLSMFITPICCLCCAGIIIPPLPEKNVVQKYQMTTEFIEARRRALTVFINRVVRGLFAGKPAGCTGHCAWRGLSSCHMVCMVY